MKRLLCCLLFVIFAVGCLPSSPGDGNNGNDNNGEADAGDTRSDGDTTDEDGGGCEDDPLCSEAGQTCEGNLIVTCATGSDGCLERTTEDCTSQGEVCRQSEASATCVSGESDCTDGIDNDQNGYTDCDDSSCDTDPACSGGSEICDNGTDDDGDGFVDCDDFDCDDDPACASSGEICDNGTDDDG
ncbi:MAG: hypothetical protein ACQEVA_20370, partial [Myxococcota bacterium]